jgi:hypothetical protein
MTKKRKQLQAKLEAVFPACHSRAGGNPSKSFQKHIFGQAQIIYVWAK